MNSDTGKAYTGAGPIKAALSRGEKLVEISSKAAASIAAGRRARSRELRGRRKRARRRDAIAKSSRRANR
jgi:topoisomerase IA-like protein